MCDNKHTSNKAVFVLEDDRPILTMWVNEIQNSLEDIGAEVKGAQTKEDAWKKLKELKKAGLEVCVFLVDLVEGEGPSGNKKWGIDFLTKIKEDFPDSFRVMFTNQAERPDIQKMLDERLIHDFADKLSVNKEVMMRKIRDMVCGINSGNIQNPSAEEDFKAFLQNWISSMPQQGKTIIDGLDGECYEAQELLQNSELRESFRKIFDGMKLDRLVRRSK